jgi:indole-3-glycerol phosphate synthase
MMVWLCSIWAILASFLLANNDAFRQATTTASKYRHVSALAAQKGLYLERMVEAKKIEVDALLRRHQEPDDPLVMRMSYMASECKYNITNSLKRQTGDGNLHTMSVLIDMKRRSPTVPHKRNIVEYSNAGKFAELLTLTGADAFLVNTDEMEYGGKFSELRDCVRATRAARPRAPPACIHKDIIIHPVQIAQALEQGASGVLLIAAIVGADLEILLDACTIMGTEAIVEVHTPNELEFALSRGATIFLVNMWDRMTGKLFPDQAKGMASLLPVNSLAIAAGDISTIEQTSELGFYGYDSVVLGRYLAEVPDIKDFIDGVHAFRGMPREMGLGMKGLPWGG